jgi:hypothetical protein
MNCAIVTIYVKWDEIVEGEKVFHHLSTAFCSYARHIHIFAWKVVDKPVARAPSSCYTFGNTSSYWLMSISSPVSFL